MSVIDSFTIKKTVADTPITEANYDRVDAAIAKAESLNKDDYKDFSAVKAAISAVDRTKNITQQAEVDAMAKAINDAVAALEKADNAASKSPNTGAGFMIPSVGAMIVSAAAIFTLGKRRKKAEN